MTDITITSYSKTGETSVIEIKNTLQDVVIEAYSAGLIIKSPEPFKEENVYRAKAA